MMAEGIESPAHLDVHSQRVAVIALTVKNLPHPRLSAGHVDVQHDVIPANNLEPALRHILAERRGLLRIPLQERPNVGHLVENKSVLRMGAQKGERGENVRKADFKILFASLEHGAFPVRVGNDPKGLLRRCFLWVSGGILPGTCLRPVGLHDSEKAPARQYCENQLHPVGAHNGLCLPQPVGSHGINPEFIPRQLPAPARCADR